MMSHEKLDVYQLSIEFVALVRQILRRIPRGNADLVDQLKRAARSIPLLIAEGVGKNSAIHQARYFADARGSVFESAACLDVLDEENLVDSKEFSLGKEMTERMAPMLTKMCR